jgi:hypothetical protein
MLPEVREQINRIEGLLLLIAMELVVVCGFAIYAAVRLWMMGVE